jgi:surface carbohydrate biosynthesis protein
MGVDILIPQVGYYERDCLVLYNMLYYLEKMGYTYKIVPYFDFLSLDRLRPKAVLMTDAHGAYHFVLFAKHAKELGIPTISLSSESNQTEKDFVDAFWGHNRKHVNYIDLRFVWNKEIKEKVHRKFPDYKDELLVSGAIGFDKYFFLDMMSRDAFLKKYKKQKYKKIVTYAGWMFDLFVNLQKDPDYYKHDYSKEEIDKRVEDLGFIRKILREMIEKYPDILFVLKKHPGKYEEHLDILDDFKAYDNTLVFHYEENIYNLLNVTDLWLSYESTTSIESWIMKKPSIQLLPMQEDRQKYERFLQQYHSAWYKGNLIAHDIGELSLAIDEFFATGQIAEYTKLKPNRIEFLKAKTEKLDGLNGYRTSLVIKDYLTKIDFRHRMPKIRPLKAMNALVLTMAHYAIIYLPFIRKYDFFRSRYRSFSDIEKNKRIYTPMIGRFARKKGVKI